MTDGFFRLVDRHDGWRLGAVLPWACWAARMEAGDIGIRAALVRAPTKTVGTPSADSAASGWRPAAPTAGRSSSQGSWHYVRELQQRAGITRSAGGRAFGELARLQAGAPRFGYTAF